MTAGVDIAQESPGVLLNRMLAGHSTFLENIYSLMRFLEAEVTKHGWDLLRNGGYGVTRNGAGRGLANFTNGDWVANQVGIDFVHSGQTAVVQGATNTQIPEKGLQLLIFQVRWFDKARGEPVVWYVKLLVEPAGSKAPKKWEEYQALVFNRLRAEDRSESVGSGRIEPGRASISGAAIVYTGDYAEVPVAAIENEKDVIHQLIEPALAM